MADPAEVADALLARCVTLAVGSPALPIAYPDRPFTPPTDGKYLEVRYFPNRPAWEGLTSGVMDQGLLQINVVWPRNVGIVAPMEAASEVRAHFAKGLVLNSGAAKVTINREPWAAAPLIEPDKTIVPVTVSWVAV